MEDFRTKKGWRGRGEKYTSVSGLQTKVICPWQESVEEEGGGGRGGGGYTVFPWDMKRKPPREGKKISFLKV